MLNIEEYYRQRQARKRVRDNYLASLQQVGRKYSIYQALPARMESKEIKSIIDPPKSEINEEQNLGLIEKENEELKVKVKYRIISAELVANSKRRVHIRIQIKNRNNKKPVHEKNNLNN